MIHIAWPSPALTWIVFLGEQIVDDRSGPDGGGAMTGATALTPARRR
jgi:hypothetical protein